ncbi:MAG: hypothetical protein AAGB24_09095 [Bacteroidota bacterium]
MKEAKIWSILAFLLVFGNSCQNLKKSNLTLFSDIIPKDTPLVFAPGIISIDDYIEGSLVFNPEMTELFFQRRKPEESHNIYTMKFMDGRWSAPELAVFSANKEYLDVHPRMSSKGNQLYFGSRRPINDSVASSGLRQWYIEKHKTGWGQPMHLSEKLFEGEWIMCVSPAANGNLYFTSKEKEDKLEDEGIYYALNQEGRYHTIEKMGKQINGHGKWIAHPYIAPDESYLIYDAERTSKDENSDLYISFTKDGAWTESYSLGSEVNTKLSEGAATVSPNGKYLFFSRGEEKIREDGSTYWMGDLYWVDFTRLKERLQNENGN